MRRSAGRRTIVTKTSLGVLRVLAALLLLACPAARAEVSADPTAGGAVAIVFGIITDDPSPIGPWQEFRPLEPGRILNADGDTRGDGRPDLAMSRVGLSGEPSGFRPLVVWAYNAGGDFDIAFSEWDGGQWTPIAFLTSGIEDERDPRLFVEADGTVQVVWWTSGESEEVYLTTREAGSSGWSAPVIVTAGTETGRRPSVAVLDGQLVVAYERDSAVPGMVRDVVAAARQAGGDFVHETVGSTVRPDPLDAVVHVESGREWAEWMHEAEEFRCAERDAEGAWIPGTPEPWNDPSWIGVEHTRKAVRTRILY